jgi:hypothetical protein
MIQLLSNKHMGPLDEGGDNRFRFQNSNKVYPQDAFKTNTTDDSLQYAALTLDHNVQSRNNPIDGI